MKKLSVSFRIFIIVLVCITALTGLLLAGSIIFTIRSNTITALTLAEAQESVESLAIRTERLLGSIEQTIIPLTYAGKLLAGNQFMNMLNTAIHGQNQIQAAYCIDLKARTFAVGSTRYDNPIHPDLQGIDFLYNPLYRTLHEDGVPVWSDTFVSILSGNTTLGVGVRIGDNATIAELNLETLLETVKVATAPDTRVLVIDRRGELVVDTHKTERAGVLNIRNVPIISALHKGERLPQLIELDNVFYHPAVAVSTKLGWVFIAGKPAGLGNAYIQHMLLDLFMFAISLMIISLITAPLWTHSLSRQVIRLRKLADQIADGDCCKTSPEGTIKEFNDLANYLRIMNEKIQQREGELITLNKELEKRVQERTLALENGNRELRQSIDTQNHMKEILVESEKQAALGRLVAGVAHEMNTPIGNALMAITSISDEYRTLINEMKDGLRRSSLEKFLDNTGHGLEISERNLTRAGELITSFKHVASDQTSSVRRKFDLSKTLEEILLTLHPMIKRSPHTLTTELPEGIELDSYPGVIGQIVTNLVTNALTHAWDEGQVGIIHIRVVQETEFVTISVIDNGKGIPTKIGKKVFEPFYTTRMGQGGTGLGLNIAYNGARNILGGTLDFEGNPGGGTAFNLVIPVVAPILIHDSQN